MAKIAIFVKSLWYFLIIFHVRALWVTYYQVTGPDSASTAIAAAAPKSRMKLISITQRIAYNLRKVVTKLLIRTVHSPEQKGEIGRDGLPYLTGDGGHTWLHSGCHRDWTAQRRPEAVAALEGFGLTPPDETEA